MATQRENANVNASLVQNGRTFATASQQTHPINSALNPLGKAHDKLSTSSNSHTPVIVAAPPSGSNEINAILLSEQEMVNTQKIMQKSEHGVR